MKKKISVSPDRLRDLLQSVDSSSDESVESVLRILVSETPSLPNWLVVLLKVIAYAIGLVLAGFATSSCCKLIF